MDESLNCLNCKKAFDIYEAAQTMPCCSKPLCHECIKLIEQKRKLYFSNFKYICLLCCKENIWPKEGFKIDKNIADTLEKKLVNKPNTFLSHDPLINSLLLKNLADLKCSVNNLMFESSNGHDIIAFHFTEQKRLLQIVFEEKIRDVTKKFDESLKELIILEQERNNYFKNFNINIKFKTVNDKINTTNLMIEAIENLNHLIQPTNYIKEIDFIKELKNDLENERKIVKNEIFDNKIIETKKVINL